MSESRRHAISKSMFRTVATTGEMMPTSRGHSSGLVAALVVIMLLAAAPAKAQSPVTATHTAAIAIDADQNALATPGDTIQYTLTIAAQGNTSVIAPAIGIDLDPAIRLVAGSVNVHPLGIDDSNTITSGTGVPATGNLLTNDAGQDPGETLVVSAVESNSTPGNVVGEYGTLTWSANGAYTYVLQSGNGIGAGQTAFEVFHYSLVDGSGEVDLSTTLTITIFGSNTAPITNPDSLQTYNNDTITVNAANGVLANDSDPENDPITVVSSSTTTSQGGTVAVNADGSFTYTPPVAGLMSGATDTFQYTAADPFGASSTALATLTAIGRIVYVDNTAPSGGNGSRLTPYDTLMPAIANAMINDTIFIFLGNGGSTGLDQQYTIGVNGLTIHGNGVNLVLNGTIQIAANAPPVLQASSGTFNVLNKNLALLGFQITSLSGSSQPIQVNYDDNIAHTFSMTSVLQTNGTNCVDLSIANNTPVTLTLTAVTFQNALNSGLEVSMGNTSSLTLTISGSTFTTNNTGVRLSVNDTAQADISVSGGSISSNSTFGFRTIIQALARATVVFNGGTSVTSNSTGLTIEAMPSSTSSLSVLNTNGSLNDVSSNQTGVSNCDSNAALTINPSGQVVGNMVNIDTGMCN